VQYDIANTEKAKGDQKAEGCLRAISSRAKRIEAKDRDALRRTDLLGALFASPDGLTDNEVEYVHERWCPTDSSRQEKRPALSLPRSEDCLPHDNIGRICNEIDFKLDSPYNG
jgi:hypothetical protein